MRSIGGDVRYAWRTLISRPGFSVVAILVLALGIGSNAAIFSVVRGVLLRPLPFRAPDQLVSFDAERFISNAELLYLREHAESFADVAALSPGWGMALTGVGEATQLTTSRVSTNLLDVLGVPPLLGRTFRADESAPGREAVVLLGHSLWTARFGGDSSVLDRQITLDGTSYTVVGVLPPDFEVLGTPPDLVSPLVIDPGAWFHRGAASIMIARLNTGATLDRARREVEVLLPRMREALEYDAAHYRDVALLSLHERTVGQLRPTLLVLLAAVALIVLIAGANVGNLLSMRAASRRRETAVRRALGATGRRVVAQMLVESVMLALGGAVLGLVLGWTGVRAIRTMLPADMARVSAISLDWTVLGACAVLAVVLGLAFGLAPALLAARANVQEALRGARGAGGHSGGERARGALVIAEIALTLVLVIGAGLMTRTLWSLTNVAPGFRDAGVLTMRLQPTGERYATSALQRDYVRGVLEQLSTIPGVRSTGAIHHLPLAGQAWYSDIDLEDRPRAPGEAPMRAGWRLITGDYFRTMGIPLLRGRTFTDADGAEAAQVAMVSEAFARAAWPGEDAIGKRLEAGNATRAGVVTVVGVVGNVRHVSLDAEPEPELYRPLSQTSAGALTMVLRVTGDPMAVAPAARRTIQAIDANVPISDVRSLAQVTSGSVAAPRLIMVLMLMFAALGLLLGAVGMYGVIAYAVGERRREIGVRIALGAPPRRVAVSVLMRGMRYATIGVAIGLAGALAATRLMRSLVYGVSITDPATFVAVSAFLVGVAAVASWLPARQAARTDPMTAMRIE
jgi:predicted permease